MRSEIVHFEIPAKNPKKLSKFYSKCFGWKFKDTKMPGMKYWMIMPSAKPKVGGGMYRKSKASQMPVNYVNTSNIEATMRGIKSAGGRIVMGKQEIPHMGWSAMALDPEGNAVGLFQPMSRQQRTSRRM